MGAVVALDTLFNGGRVWKGRPAAPPSSVHPTGLAALDAVLPTGGWPEAALSEILMAKEGVGELQLVLPTLARLSKAGERIVLVAPPYTPYPHAWQNAGVDLRLLSVIQAEERDALWAVEQCLRSGSCGAVLCWPRKADDRALRRLQVAAETGQTLAFAWRALSESVNSSPAALRLAVEAKPAQVRVLKCRGGLAHPAPIALAGH
ncbi:MULTISPECIES: translesion DNA synthesis-associated protein ImuA [unclassified Pseudomonas]|uniref:translesion DNA synthesis-associated protein ImuA n=1 Tax=unclassified Pseudomonas TaxID=196821 RepID=UPI0008AE1CFA|nr:MULTISPECIES: translesion DNA synthesis-associated protein ImuA [unclassified Pseudomonas]PMV17594.1 translesion DNA synthesis-associated protein ImuA [Pseudomonas sp. FW305-3-2-15-C-TSA2]PMV18668.1 translesion DNA synthesis-associated protein ImuA [Pseudomonas sp. DP16D-L5]PMV32320.1 translesion DNA synthesis-associated protein ImuA [Pseudomonas sp. FW305-3-2-15-A-LB2]PMV41989.1 translesion DNA synthesis-associated protein ImuA [Pseudomonas sp. FW305-3-2-15-C-LB1]PMV43178.1 translesion DNA